MCFRNIPGYDGRYQINETGDVKSVECDCVVRNIKRRDGEVNEKELWHRKTKFLRPITTGTLKPHVHLYDKESKRKTFYIAQLVLMSFVTDGQLVPIRRIKYRDGNPCNYCVDNLYVKSL
jgi:hypothetical protein